MTKRQKKFAEEFVKCNNAKQAAINAGYSFNYAIKCAYLLKCDKNIVSYMDVLREIERLKRNKEGC